MAGVSYEEGKKKVAYGFRLLGVITIVEVIIALLGNGHIVEGFTITKVIMYPVMIGLSLYKAYFIVNEFMHMKYEVRGLAMSVVLPTMLLIWAVIAFLQEGGAWGQRRAQIKQKDAIQVNEGKATGQLQLVHPTELTGELKVY